MSLYASYILALLFGLLATLTQAHAREFCLGRVSAQLLDRYGDLPTATVLTETFGGIGEPILIPLWDQKRIGYKRITKLREIGAGQYGTVYLANAVRLDGKIQPIAWKEVRPQEHVYDLRPATEKAGMSIQYLAAVSEGGAESGIVPVHARLYTKRKTVAGVAVSTNGVDPRWQGYAISLEGPSVGDLMHPGRELSLRADKDSGIPANRPGKVLRETARMVLDVSAAESKLSKKGIFHRDIKPENILRTKDGRYKVIDFGVSTMEGAEPTGLTGTLGYIPHEKFAKPVPPDTVVTDVYPLAVTAMECLLGMGPHSVELKQEVQLPFGPGVDSRLLSQAKVKIALADFRKKKLENPADLATPDEIELFDELERFILDGIEPNPRARMEHFQKHPSPFLRISADAKNLGPVPQLLPRALQKKAIKPQQPSKSGTRRKVGAPEAEETLPTQQLKRAGGR